MLALVLVVPALAAFDVTPFASLPEDPPPKEITRGQHYWVSNEERPELFKPELEAVGGGGVLIGVGAEQNYVYAGWARPDVMILMDFDGSIPDMHRGYFTVFRHSETRAEFLKLLRYENQAQLYKDIAEDYPDLAMRKRVVAAVKEARTMMRVHADRISAGFIKRKVPTFFTDDEQFAFVRQMVLDGRVFPVRGDLTGANTMKAIGDACKRAGLSVHELYMSNAEQYFTYSKGFRANMLALPFDEKGIVLRTNAWGRFGYAKEGNSYHYDVQNGISMQSWAADERTKSVVTILEAAPRKNGFSKMVAPPETPIAVVALPPAAPPVVGVTVDGPPAPPPIPIENAPDVVQCANLGVPGMSCVPGGPFLRGIDKPAKLDEDAAPQATVWVQTFYMDQREITYAEYKACEREGKCAKAGPTYLDFNAPKQPINGVSWYDAKQYCEQHGKRLPTEAEWEKAARGTDGRLFPWGNEWANCKRAVIKVKEGRSCGIKQKSEENADVGRPEPVGSKPAALYGLYDMAGNAFEWVADWYSESYGDCGAACAGVNPKGPCGGVEPCAGHTERVVRGGSWFWPAPYATTYHRRAHIPLNKPLFHHFGFRCAADVDAAKTLAGSTTAQR